MKPLEPMTKHEAMVRQHMEHNVRRWLALRFPRGTRRRTDHRITVKRFDVKGDRVV